MSDDLLTKRYEDFLKDLTKLTKKHKIEISGCGCCGSPRLTPLDEYDPLEIVYSFNYKGEGDGGEWVQFVDKDGKVPFFSKIFKGDK